MHYVMQGKIAKAHPYQLDKTLTLEGAGAEAQAVGKAIDEVKKHSELKDNPHNVTAQQVGLGNVDNTADMEKPVSTKQKEAIDIAKNVADNAQATADNAQSTADDAKSAAVNAQSTADDALTEAGNALSAAGDAHSRANDAYTLANGKCSVNLAYIRLSPSSWSDNLQHVTVDGLGYDDAVFLCPHTSSREEYFRCGVYGLTSNTGDICFECEEVPTVELNVICYFFTTGVAE